MPDKAYSHMPGSKPLVFVGSSKKALIQYPREVMRVMGHALNHAQAGGKHPDAKALKRFAGASVLEIVEDYDGNTYRAVYTVRLAGVVYVLHAFQKKSKRGIGMPKHEMDLIRSRLKEAEGLHAARIKGGTT